MYDDCQSVASPVLVNNTAQLLTELAELDEFEYEVQREDVARSLGIRVSVLDKKVAELRPAKSSETGGKVLELPEPEPWPHPVNGVELLDQLVAIFTRYLALSEGSAEAMALWVLHTFAMDTTTISPRLAITSPEKRCGKTTALSILQGLVRNLLIEQGGFPGREMWPKRQLNARQPSSAKTDGG